MPLLLSWLSRGRSPEASSPVHLALRQAEAHFAEGRRDAAISAVDRQLREDPTSFQLKAARLELLVRGARRSEVAVTAAADHSPRPEPVEARSADAHPAEAQPAGAQLAEAEPAKPRPVEPPLAEPQPVEAQHCEEQPVAAPSAQTKPADPRAAARETLQTLVEEARRLRQADRWEAALALLGKASSMTRLVRLETGRNLLFLGRFRAVLAHFEAYPLPELGDQLVRVARVAMGEGALEADDLPVALQLAQRLEAREADAAVCERLLRAAFDAAPDSIDVARRLVAERPEEAAALTARFRGTPAEAADLWSRAAKARRRAGDLAGASRDFAAALEVHDTAAVRLDACDTLIRQGRGRDALEVVLSLDSSDDPYAIVQIARAFDAAGDFVGATERWTRVLEADPDNLAALRGVARMQQADKKLAAALDTARRAVRHPQREFADVLRVSRLMRYLNRNTVLDRVLRRSEHRFRAGRIGAADHAEALLAADLPSRAEAVLAAAEAPDARNRGLRLRCMVVRLDYIAAARFLAAHPEAGEDLPRRERARVALADRLAREWGVRDDAELHARIIARMLALGRDPVFGYDPEPGKMLLTCSSLGLGGSERQTLNLAQAVAQGAGGIRATTMLVNSQRGKSYELEDRFGTMLDIHYLRDVTEQHGGNDLSLSPQFAELQQLEDLLDLGGTAVTARAFRALRPEKLSYRVGPIAQTVLAAAIVGVPHTLIQFGSMTRRHQRDGSELFDLRERIVTLACRAAAENPSIVFGANSRLACNEWAEQIGLDPARMGLIYNGLDEAGLGDPAPERAAEVRRALGIPAGAFVLGAVFRFEPVKDPMLWIETAARLAEALPDCHFLLAGDGPLRDAMRRRAEEGGFADRLHMPGAVFSGLRAYYGAMNAFLLTSHTESLPNVVIEAQISGVPVVVTNAGGVREGIATNESGRVAEGRSPEELAALVRGYHDDSALRARVAREAPEVIRERFSVAQMVRSTLACFWPHPAAEAPTAAPTPAPAPAVIAAPLPFDTVTPIGSCRIAKPLRLGRARHPFRINGTKVYGYCHTSAEAVQMARVLRGELEPPEEVWPLIGTGDRERLVAAQHRPSDLYVIELCSPKQITLGHWTVQLNYTVRTFRAFFREKGRAAPFWRLAEQGVQKDIDAFLEAHWHADADQRADAATLRRLRCSGTTPEQLRADVATLQRLLPATFFVTHVNALSANGAPIATRAAFIEQVRQAVADAGQEAYDPTVLMQRFGQDQAIDAHSDGLAHFQDPFMEALIDDWIRTLSSRAAAG